MKNYQVKKIYTYEIKSAENDKTKNIFVPRKISQVKEIS